MIDITTGDILSFSGKYTFAPYDSLMLLDDGSQIASESEGKRERCKVLNLDGDWTITNCSENILTLDTYDVYFDMPTFERR